MTAEIHKLPVQSNTPKDAPQGEMPAFMGELLDVLKRHQGNITYDDGVNVLGNLSMVFMGQDEARAAELLHETFLGLTAFYELPVVVERTPDGKGTMRVSGGDE